jgi:phosphodiesterase/alkaline phosphatase D-like protein
VTTKNASGLNGSTIYYYRVRAYNAGGTGGNSGTITTTTLPNPPPAPTANAASNVTNSSFTANWSSANGATGYRLDVSTNNTFSNYVSGYQNLDVGSVLLRVVTNLTAGKTYYYRVRAYNGSGTSSNSSIITVITLPPILNASRQGSNLTLSWPTNDPAFYLELATNASSPLVWVSNAVVPSIVNGQYTTSKIMTNKFRLYRLKK